MFYKIIFGFFIGVAIGSIFLYAFWSNLKGIVTLLRKKMKTTSFTKES